MDKIEFAEKALNLCDHCRFNLSTRCVPDTYVSANHIDCENGDMNKIISCSAFAFQEGGYDEFDGVSD
jgi:hypothetical protein